MRSSLSFSFACLVAQLLVFGSLATALDSYSACPNGISVVYLSDCLVSFPVVINQFIEVDTVLDVNFYGNITISNAPIQFRTTVIATSTSTIISTATTTASASVTTATTSSIVSSSAVTSTPFVISFQIPGARKRQLSPYYLTSGGSRTTDKTKAQQYVQNTVSPGTYQFQAYNAQKYISYSPGTGATTLSLNDPKSGMISTSIQSSESGISWTNEHFSGGAAAFYYDPNTGSVLAVGSSTYDVSGLEAIVLSAVSGTEPALPCIALNFTDNFSGFSLFNLYL